MLLFISLTLNTVKRLITIIHFGVHCSPLFRFLEPPGGHQAIRLSGCDHRRQVLLVLLLPAQHRCVICGDRCGQSQEKLAMGHWEPASLWQHSGWRSGWHEWWSYQAPGPVPFEQAVGVFVCCLFESPGRNRREMEQRRLSKKLSKNKNAGKRAADHWEHAALKLYIVFTQTINQSSCVLCCHTCFSCTCPIHVNTLGFSGLDHSTCSLMCLLSQQQ